MFKKGDTLVEVTLAIGIFSMVAISVALVISGSTSGSQLSLETTLAREEIDTQAEVIRFIHDSYISSSGDEADQYKNLWEQITANAVKASEIDEIEQYAPSSCSNIYDPNNSVIKKAFVINPRNLEYVPLYDKSFNKINEKAGITTTYPRLVIDGGGLKRIEGIYTIATEHDEYYEFYIRTCWYGTNDEEPSTISTAIRLHDPTAKPVIENPDVTAYLYKDNTLEAIGLYKRDKKQGNAPYSLWGAETPTKQGYDFDGWCKYDSIFDLSSQYVLNSINKALWGERTIDCYGILGGEKATEITNSGTYYLLPTWKKKPYEIIYHYNNKSDKHNCGNDPCSKIEFDGSTPTKDRLVFAGWCVDDPYGNCENTYSNDSNILEKNYNPSTHQLNLYAKFIPEKKSVSVALTWYSFNVLGVHVTLNKLELCMYNASSGSTECADKNGKNFVEAALEGRQITKQYELDSDKDYYFYTKSDANWIMEALGNVKRKAEIKVTDLTTKETKVYESKDAIGTGPYWNIFSYKDKIVPKEKQNFSNEPQVGY